MKKTKRSFLFSRKKHIVFLILALLATRPLPALARETLVFGVPPYKRATELKKNFSPLIKYLERQTGEEIQFRSAKSGGAMVNAFVKGAIDIAYLMPALYIRADQQSNGKVQILKSILNQGKPFFKGVIAVKNDSPIQTLQDLHGKKFAFGFRESTLAFYIPAYMLMQEGLMDSMKFKHVGAPDNVAISIQKNFFDAGGIPPDLAAKYVGKSLKILQQSEPIRNAVFVTGPDISPDLRKKFEDAFAQLEDMSLLQSIGQGINGLTDSTPEDFDNLRTIIQAVDKKFPRQ